MIDISSLSQAAWPCLLPEADLYSASHQSNTHSVKARQKQPQSQHRLQLNIVCKLQISALTTVSGTGSV